MENRLHPDSLYSNNPTSEIYNGPVDDGGPRDLEAPSIPEHLNDGGPRDLGISDKQFSMMANRLNVYDPNRTIVADCFQILKNGDDHPDNEGLQERIKHNMTEGDDRVKRWKASGLSADEFLKKYI